MKKVTGSSPKNGVGSGGRKPLKGGSGNRCKNGGEKY